jgi:predicted PurR-regulated permease PerM
MLTREMTFNWPRLRDQALVLVATLFVLQATGQFLGHFLRILVVLLLATLLAFALEPALRRLDRFLPRWLAALGVYVVVASTLAVLVALFGQQLGTQANQLAQHLPGYIDRAGSWAERTAAAYGIPISQSRPTSALAGSATGAARDVLATGASIVALVSAGVVDAVMVIVITYYFMVDGKRFRDVSLRVVPARHREKLEFVEDAVWQVVGSYIRGQLVLAAIIGVAAGLGCWLLGVRYPLVIAVLAFLFELVPMIGPVLSAIPALVIAVFQGFPLVLEVGAYFFVIQQVENHVLAPRISGHAVGLHPVAALVALVAGADAFGIWGALFAVPIAGVLVVLASAALKAWRGEPVVVERGRMRLRLPLRNRRREVAG